MANLCIGRTLGIKAKLEPIKSRLRWDVRGTVGSGSFAAAIPCHGNEAPLQPGWLIAARPRPEEEWEAMPIGSPNALTTGTASAAGRARLLGLLLLSRP